MDYYSGMDGYRSNANDVSSRRTRDTRKSGWSGDPSPTLLPADLSVKQLFDGKPPALHALSVSHNGGAVATFRAEGSKRELVMSRWHTGDAWRAFTDREAGLDRGNRSPMQLTGLHDDDAAAYELALTRALSGLGRQERVVAEELIVELQVAAAAPAPPAKSVPSVPDLARRVLVDAAVSAIEKAVRTPPGTVDVPVPHPRSGFKPTAPVNNVVTATVLDTSDYGYVHLEGDIHRRSVTKEWPPELQQRRYEVQDKLLHPAEHLESVEEAVRARAQALGFPHVVFARSRQSFTIEGSRDADGHRDVYPGGVDTIVRAYLSREAFPDLDARARPDDTIAGATKRLLARFVG